MVELVFNNIPSLVGAVWYGGSNVVVVCLCLCSLIMIRCSYESGCFGSLRFWLITLFMAFIICLPAPGNENAGKDKVINYHNEVSFRLLNEKPEYSVNSNETENLLIKGDNLEALKALLPYYYNKIKAVYIEPPYNTGPIY